MYTQATHVVMKNNSQVNSVENRQYAVEEWI